jgi:hypothetical protein
MARTTELWCDKSRCGPKAPHTLQPKPLQPVSHGGQVDQALVLDRQLEKVKTHLVDFVEQVERLGGQGRNPDK